MKALFESRFPFVKQPDSELTPEQLLIKKQYNEAYPTIEADQLREVHVDEPRTRKRGK